MNAIALASGLWIGRRYLIVKKASFERRQQSPDYGKIKSGLNRFDPMQYAQSLNENGRDSYYKYKDSTKIKELEKRVTINLGPTAPEWLWRSAIAELKEVSTPEIILKAFTQLNFKDVIVRSMGVRNDALRNQVIKEWFQSFKHWKGDASSLSLVWLKIRGMPSNAWELKSFKKIVESWGEFLTLDQETLSMEAFDVGRLLMVTSCKYKIDEWINVIVKGRNYYVQVWEEECDDPFDVKGVKHIDHQINTNSISNSVKDGASHADSQFKDKEEGILYGEKYKKAEKLANQKEYSEKMDELALESNAGDNELVVFRDINAPPNENCANRGTIKGTEPKVDFEHPNPWYADSLMGTNTVDIQESPLVEEVQETAIQMVQENQNKLQAVNENAVLEKSPDIHTEPNNGESEFKLLPAFIIPKVLRAKKRKELRALCDSLEEYDRISGGYQSSNNNNSNSISSGDIANRNEVILRELKDAIEVNKILNVNFHESDEATLNRLLQLEVVELKRRKQLNPGC
ncbi:hypothetical protein Vadar_021810 [Vaccinium darrowii]|uniref:Uncharacterized protein n=1 Tax=Vaccinium darrowii TaxID=229202 RepID=A0ACB7XJ35_9ERIC|nr:hypothetical protein Vadar_021810 [Vaccinium darrowii]